MKKIVVVLMTIVMALAACTSVQESKELFEKKCVECHKLDEALSATKDLAGWKKTTKAMIRYSDGRITEKDAKKIAKYLAGRK
jgi:cytochrome c2